MMGLMTFLPLGFFGGYIPALILKKAGLLRVPLEVEMEGLDIAEFGTDFFPEFARPHEAIIMPDGTRVEAAPVLTRGLRPGAASSEPTQMIGLVLRSSSSGVSSSGGSARIAGSATNALSRT